MVKCARVLVHPTQFPEFARANLLNALRERRVPGKCHYESARQAQRWLEVHQAYSPFKTQCDVGDLYRRAAQECARRLGARPVNVISLGCGGGEKDCLVARALIDAGARVRVAPTDVSLPLVLTARNALLSLLPPGDVFPLVWDMEQALDWREAVDCLEMPEAPRVVTFFGMLPNFAPSALQHLPALLGNQSLLLVSANLAPGPCYEEAVERLLPAYDNPQTRDWLTICLNDLGIDASPRDLRFRVGLDSATQWLRIVCALKFKAMCAIRVSGVELQFQPGEELSVFTSYRHTPELISAWAARLGLGIHGEWISSSGEEGVFCLGRNQGVALATS